METEHTRVGRIRRYREQALDHAALIAALSAARHDAVELDELASRQDEQLQELIHDFAFRARKLIELTRREGLPSAAYASQETLFCTREGGDADMLDMGHMSLQQVLGRIIHSDRFAIRRGNVPQRDGNLDPRRTAWAFTVASDKDAPNEQRLVFIEFLLTEFLAFDRELARDLRRFSP